MLTGVPRHPAAACFFCAKGLLTSHVTAAATHAAATVHAAAATAHAAGAGLGAVVGGDTAAVDGEGAVAVNGEGVLPPAPMAMKMAPISRAEPGADRKRTRLKAPATATPAPTLPLTIMITTQTTAGSRASVAAKLPLLLARHMVMAHSCSPRRRETPIHSRNVDGAMAAVSPVSNTPRKIESSILQHSFLFRQKDIPIGGPVFGKRGLEKLLLGEGLHHPEGQSAGGL